MKIVKEKSQFIFIYLIATAFSNKDLASSNLSWSFKIFAKLFIA